MKRFVINCSIDQEILEKFIQCVDESGDEQITIYLTSHGSSESAAYIILDIINSNPDKFKLHALERVFSAAFELFFMAKCERIIAPYTVGMCHIAGAEMRVDMRGKPVYDTDGAILKSGKARINDLARLLMNIGTDIKDIRRIKKGEDVYFQSWQMAIMLNFQLNK